MTTPDSHPKLAEARAILRSTRAALCPHGVRWSDCNQHDNATTKPDNDREDHA